MATVADFQNRFPEFSNVDEDRVQLFLDDAALIMGTSGKWLKFFDVAHQYYAAHFLTVATATEFGDSGVLAPVTHQEVDDVVIKNAIGDIKPTMEDVYSTSYGKQFANYRRMCFNGMIGI